MTNRHQPANATDSEPNSARRLRRVAVWTGFWLLVAFGLAVFCQRRLVFNNWGPSIPFAPRRHVEVDEVWLTTADGARLHAWFAACPSSISSAVSGPRPVILFCHGNSGSLPRWRWVAARWQDALGADVLLFDYRGYGKSIGCPTERGLMLDARAAYEWLTNERGVEPNRIVLVGQSLGGGVIASLAATVEHRMLVLESTFTSMPDVANDLCFGIPVGVLMTDEFRNVDRLRGYCKPAFLSHGTADRLISPRHTLRLAEVLDGPWDAILIEGMPHHDGRPPAYEQTVRAFVQQHWQP